MIKYYLMTGVLVVASLGGYKVADWQWQAKWSAHMTADAEANAKAAQDAIDKQNELTAQLDRVKSDEKDWQEKYAKTVADNSAANKRLRDEFDRIKSMHKTGDSGIVSVSSAAATDRLVLTRLLDQSHARNGILAEYADRNRQAVINCNAEYNAVRKAAN
jgi:hypothetical protein